MTEYSKETHNKLMALARKHIEDGNHTDFFKLIAHNNETYTRVEQKPHSYVETTGSYELGLHDETVHTTIDVEVKYNYFTLEDKRLLLAHALKENNLEIINGLYDKGYSLNRAQFKTFCNKNPDAKAPLVAEICEKYFNAAIQSNNTSYLKTILENSPHLDSNPQAFQRFEIIKPLFLQLNELNKIEKNEANADNTHSSTILHSHANNMHHHMKDFITGKTDGKTFDNKAEFCTKNAMKGLEEQSEGIKILKNILLTLTVIGPIIKKIATGNWFFENSTTSAAREMKDSLSLIKASGKLSEPESNPELETKNPGMH